MLYEKFTAVVIEKVTKAFNENKPCTAGDIFSNLNKEWRNIAGARQTLDAVVAMLVEQKRICAMQKPYRRVELIPLDPDASEH